MSKIKIIFLSFIKTLSILVFILNITSSFADDFVVNDIKVIGERRLSKSFVLKYVPEFKNGVITDQILNNITKNLYMSGFFSDVKVKVKQNTLEINIKEFPIVNEVSFVGNDFLDEDQLISIVNIKSRDVFNKELIKEAIENIRTEYQGVGRYLAEVNIKKSILSEGRVDLTFEIIEGSLLVVKNINFIGNNVFSDNELKSAITTKENAWYKIFGSNKFVPSRLEYDKEKLYSFYKERGYINFVVKLARGDLLPDFSGFNINFVIEEGSRFKINNVNIKSNLKDKSNKNIINKLTVKQGEYFDTRALDESTVYLNNYYSELGYSFVKVTPTLTENKDLVDVTFLIDEGRKAYINKISIVGNTRTTDSVIRRELSFLEGDSFNRTKITESVKALKRLSYFSSVNYRVDRANEINSVDVILNVVETNTGSFSFGVGYSSLNNSSLSFGIDEKNFLGKGVKLTLQANISDKQSTYNLGFTEPYYLFKPISLSGNIFNKENENSKGDIKTTKTGFGFGLGIKEDMKSHRMSYKFSQNESTTTSTSTAQSITGEAGKDILTSSITYSLSKDTRDSYYNPTTGSSWSIRNTLAGLGGDAKFLKSEAKFRTYKPINYGDYIFAFKSGAGIVSTLDDKITRSNRFLLTGNIVRGFDNSGVGPRDLGNKGVVGGNYFYNSSIELTSDKFLPEDTGLQWLLFSDLGSLWGTDYKSGVQGFNDSSPRITAGFGVSMKTALGPLSVLWGYPLQSETYDVEENFQFSIGTTF